MYKRYTLFMTKYSPFIWSHRLEFPVVGGLAGWVIAIALGNLIDITGFASLSTYDANTLFFLLFAFGTILVTITWLVSVSRTIDLPQSFIASRYPILTVIALGAVFLNAPAYIFSNIALRPEQLNGGEWPLLTSTSGQLWTLVGLMFGLSLVSIFVSFAVLSKKSGLIETILSLFGCLGIVSVLGVFLIPFGTSSQRDFVFALIVMYLAIWIVLVVVNLLFLKGVLFRGHAIFSGISLFAFTFGLIWFFAYPLIYIFTTNSQTYVSEKDWFSPSVQAAVFAMSLVLGEAIMAIIRRKRYRIV